MHDTYLYGRMIHSPLMPSRMAWRRPVLGVPAVYLLLLYTPYLQSGVGSLRVAIGSGLATQAPLLYWS